MLRNEDKIVGCFLYDCYDEEIGKIQALFVDQESFALRYCIVTIGGLLGTSGKTILLPKGILEPKGIGKVVSSKSQAIIFDAPASFDIEKITQEDELKIHEYFDIQPYFEVEEGAKGEEGIENGGN